MNQIDQITRLDRDKRKIRKNRFDTVTETLAGCNALPKKERKKETERNRNRNRKTMVS